MHEQDFTGVVKRLIPMVQEIRDTVGHKNGLEIYIDPDGGFKAKLYEPINEGYYNSLAATYTPPTKEIIQVEEVDY